MPKNQPGKYSEWETTAKKAAQEMERNEAPGQGLKGNSSLRPAPFNPLIKEVNRKGSATEENFKGRQY